MYLSGTENSSERYIHTTIYKELLKAIANREFDKEDIPEMTTIKNWIQKYHIKYMKMKMVSFTYILFILILILIKFTI
jgi:hypothetical protein